MTLPSSGSLSYNTIRAEFGSPSTNVYLSLYYRGGPYAYPVPANANITTSSTGTISVANFYGADNSTDYLKVIGTTYNSGGKSPIIYYGTGAPGNGIGNIPDATFKVGSSFFTIGTNKDFHSNSANTLLTIGNLSPTGYGDSNWRQRNIYIYNSSGTNTGRFRTGIKAGYTGTPDTFQQPNPSGVYNQNLDNVLAGPTPAGSQNTPGGAATWISGSASSLSTTFYVKAF
tara:strand:+ start:1544 stop:2230 length:687 start_codon:yes stop_codon:yes gene_type:complete